MALSCVFILLGAGPARAAEAVTVLDLVNNAEIYDGQVVVIEGEAIGDVMLRGDYAWITVNDDPYVTLEAQEERLRAGYNNSINVRVSRSMAEKIDVLGGYKNVGDRVRVTGVFHRVDSDNGGATDIVAESLEVLEKGQPVDHPLGLMRWVILFLLAGLALVMWRVRRARILASTGRM
jgi:hypothetical protein